MKKAKRFERSFIQEILSAVDMMKLGKLIIKKERSSSKILIEKFNMKSNEG